MISFYNIIETCTDDCHICYVFPVLCQEVADAEDLAVEVVVAIMTLDIFTTQQHPADGSDVRCSPCGRGESDAVPAAEEMPAAVEVGKQSDVIIWYTFLTNCNIRRRR